MAAFEAATGTSLPVDFEELVGDKVVNGFRFDIAAAKTPLAVRELLLFTAAVFRRLRRAVRHRSGRGGGQERSASAEKRNTDACGLQETS